LLDIDCVDMAVEIIAVGQLVNLQMKINLVASVRSVGQYLGLEGHEDYRITNPLFLYLQISTA